jgi:hypothetical protein
MPGHQVWPDDISIAEEARITLLSQRERSRLAAEPANSRYVTSSTRQGAARRLLPISAGWSVTMQREMTFRQSTLMTQAGRH